MKEGVGIFIIIMILALIAIIGISDSIITKNRDIVCKCIESGDTKDDVVECLSSFCEGE